MSRFDPYFRRPLSGQFRRNLLAIALPLLTLSTWTGPANPTLLAKEPPAATVAKPVKPRDDLPGLKNFAQLSSALSRGAQPTVEGFATLKARGIKTIVNLRSEHSDRSMLAGTGLQYVEIPCNPFHISDEQVAKFLKVVRDPKNQPVFVHCAVGCDRTGAMVGAYRLAEQHWTKDDTIKELHRFGYHPIYVQVESLLKSLDPAAIDGKIAAAPRQKVEVVK